MSLPGALDAALVVTIKGAAQDYESQLLMIEGGVPSTTATRGADDTLRVFSEPLGDGQALNQGRAIFQFDLSVLATLADENPVVGSAKLRLTLLGVSEAPPFGIDLWGRSDNLGGPIGVGDDAAASQFGSISYGPVGGGSFPDSAFEPQTVELDIGSYLNARYQEFRQGGDSWVLFRLQADQTLNLNNAPAATYSFASADHLLAAYHPEIELTVVPEPTLPLLLAVALAGGAFRRRRSA